MVKLNTGLGGMPRILHAVLIYASAAIFGGAVFPPASAAQEAAFDLTSFDCWKIRRDGDVLELDRLTSDGPVATVFSCNGRSCVNRAFIEAKDGTVSEVFRHIYLPRDRMEYVSVWAMWRAGADRAAIHRSNVYQLVDCKAPLSNEP